MIILCTSENQSISIKKIFFYFILFHILFNLIARSALGTRNSSSIFLQEKKLFVSLLNSECKIFGLLKNKNL